MLFCIRLPNFHPNRTTYCGNITSCRFFKIATAAAQYYFRIPICWCHCLQKVNVYQQTKFCRHISIHGWDTTTSGLEKQTSAILEFYFWFQFRPFLRNLHVILHHAAEFRPNRSTHRENMTSYSFLKKTAAQYYIRFSIFWCRCLQKVNVYQLTKFRQHISIHGWYITSSVSEKQTSAIFEFYFRFRSRPFRRHLHVTLHQSAEFPPNRSTLRRNMTSYPFLKTATAAAQYYFRFRICWRHRLQKIKVCQQTKFRQHISIHGWYITTSGFEKQTSAILEFGFRFRSRPFAVIAVSFCIRMPNFVQIGASTAEL